MGVFRKALFCFQGLQRGSTRAPSGFTLDISFSRSLYGLEEFHTVSLEFAAGLYIGLKVPFPILTELNV